MKKIIAAFAFGMCLVSPVLADNSGPAVDTAKVCEQPWAAVKDKLSSAEGSVVIQLDASQIKNLIDKVGQPPRTEGDFEAFYVTQGNLAAIFIVKDGCTTDRLGPGPSNIIKGFVGLGDA